MGFIDRFNLSHRTPPVRAYLHRSGAHLYQQSARYFLENILEKDMNEFNQFDYLIAAMWGDDSTGERIIDFFGYSGLHSWPGNPDVSSLVMKNGIITPQKIITCGDTLILLGKKKNIVEQNPV